MTRTTITLPNDVGAFLKDEARRRGTSVSELVRSLIVKGLVGASDRPREIPWAGIVDDLTLTPAERLDEALAESWAHDIARDRG